jgi:hypothetical protein
MVAVNLRTLPPDPGDGRLAGVKAPVTPLGNPVTEKATVPLKPPLTATLNVTLLFDPGMTETELAEGVT